MTRWGELRQKEDSMYHRGALALKVLGIAGVVAMVASACGGAAAPTTAPQPTKPPSATATTASATVTRVPSTPARTATAAPKRGGVIKLYYEYDPAKFDSAHYGIGRVEPASPIFNNLIERDQHTNKVIPDLARTWEQSGDGLTYTFRLAKDVKWHDGVPFTSKDVLYSLNRLLPGAKLGYSSPLTDLLRPVKNVEALDDTTVKVTLSAPSASFFYGLTSIFLNIIPEHQPIDELNKAPIGTGPFKFVKYEPAIKVTEAKNADYWEKGYPYLDGLEWIIIKDRNQMIAALKSGQIDMTFGGSTLAASNVAALQKDKPEIVFEGFVSGRWLVTMQNRPPWNDQRVRTAINLALDRKEFVGLALEGAGYPYGLFEIPQSAGGEWGLPESEIKKLPGFSDNKAAEIAQAKKMLEDAGYAAGSINKEVIVRDQYVDGVSVVIAQLKRIGINLTTRVVDSATWNKDLPAGNFEVNIGSAFGFIDDPASFIGQFFLSDSSRNYGKMPSPDVDALYKAQDAILDPQARLQKNWELERLLHEKAYQPVAGWWKLYQGWYPYVKNYTAGSMYWSNRWGFKDIWLDK